MRILSEIEKQHGVKILYAVEAGSRAWGYESDHSDYDVRFIYVQPVRHYLSLHHEKDVIEIQQNEVDFVGWDIKKALSLLHKSNPSALEWLTEENIYLEHQTVGKIRDLAIKGFSPFTVTSHYYQMATKNMRFVSQQPFTDVKKWLNVIRPVLSCLWIEKFQSSPPNNLSAMLSELELKEAFKEDIEKVLQLKKKGVSEVALNTIPSLFKETNDELVRIEDHLKNCRRNKQGNIKDFEEVFHVILEEIGGMKALYSIN
ncbi:nucleotidyltransferase domain-containing protein [Rossellomorea oryzaecorticis]|uniref:Nucleotidyltransferase domain-containing protein n=1 Tax=Rossellomorea oryzaecorticis TaxID=1396505 RepID=A0ABU9KDP2_9BACI